MKFNTRNLYYLRLSAGAVIPLYVYLDERHVPWMSERVLQHVLADLRPLITTKLIAEENANLGPGGSASAKKGTVDVHRGDTYQFGYFLRNTDPHAVLIKTRRFTAAPKVMKSTNTPLPHNHATSTDPTADRKRSRKAAAEPKSKKSAKGKRKAKRVSSNTEEEAEFSDSEEGADVVLDRTAGMAVRKLTGKRTTVAANYVDDEEDEADTGEAQLEYIDDKSVLTEQAEDTGLNGGEEDHSLAPPEEDTLMIEEEEEKPKPIMRLRYQGFSVHGRCLCVIVEPYPPIRQQRQVSLAPTGILAPRGTSIAPPDFVPSGTVSRSKTPLFLPDDDDDLYVRDATPAPMQQRSRPPVPLFNETPSEAEGADEDNGGMMAFSQVLHTMGDHYTGAADDDDEMEGMVLFGDADEVRGLS